MKTKLQRMNGADLEREATRLSRQDGSRNRQVVQDPGLYQEATRGWHTELEAPVERVARYPNCRNGLAVALKGEVYSFSTATTRAFSDRSLAARARAICAVLGLLAGLSACGDEQSKPPSGTVVKAEGQQQTGGPKQTDKAADVPASLPDFAAIKDVKQRKRSFFAYLRPLVLAENARLLGQRLRILGLRDAFRAGEELPERDREWLSVMSERYRIDPTDQPSEEMFRKLLLRVDIVPLELALAQAATESAWGRSRFAREGNNLFGEWCFEEDCGIVPKRRPAGATHEVAVFSSPAASVKSYIENLNSHRAYRQFRVLRSEKHSNGTQPDGHTLAAGLKSYSGIGMEYVRKLRAVMRQNRNLIQIPEARAASRQHGE